MAREIPNANREQLKVTIMKLENHLWKFLALQNHAGRVVLDLQRNIWYTSLGEQKAIFWKKLNAILNADDQNGCWKVQCFFQFISETAISEVKIFNKIIHSLGLTSQKLYLNQQRVRITLHETKENFWKYRAFANSLTNCGLTPPNCTKLSDSLVQSQKQYENN